MRRLILGVMVAIPLCTGQAFGAAGAMHANGALGFHDSDAPLGVRWWFSGQQVGLDAGIGFFSDGVSTFALEVGVPFVFHSWDRAHLLLRPGLLFEDLDVATVMQLSGEIEAEVFLVDNVSVSASHGIAFASINPEGPADSETVFGTFGNNFTNIGFHVYFFGGGQ